MTAPRNTLVLTASLYDQALAAPHGTTLIGRHVSAGTRVVMIATRLGEDAAHDEAAIELGPGGLVLDAADVAGVMPGPDGSSIPVHAVRVVGDSWRLLLSASADAPPPVFDRQVRAFGKDGQHLLSQLHVGVVGAGGTGSAVCEQLIRLGVGEITVIDDDVINDDGSNVTRIWGSTMSDIGTPKVSIVDRTATNVGLNTTINAIAGTINDEEPARALRHCDVVLGCTDDNRGRLTLSRLAVWYLIPVIDMGVKLSSSEGTVTNIDGRITVVHHATGCLMCRGRIDHDVLRSEALPPQERNALVAESYAVGLAERDPAVVAYTTAVAALAVSEMLNRLLGLDVEHPSSEFVVRFHQRSIGRSTRTGREDHWCTDPANTGAGDTEQFLGTVWTT
jgi:molybdopterin/thiamine biosynthesis adenylyltransferase